jgi:hypothetical protein
MTQTAPSKISLYWQMQARAEIWPEGLRSYFRQSRRAPTSAPAGLELWRYCRITVPIPVIIPVIGPVMPAAVAVEDPTDSQAYTVPAAIIAATASFSSALRIATAPFCHVPQQDIIFPSARNREFCRASATVILD